MNVSTASACWEIFDLISTLVIWPEDIELLENDERNAIVDNV